MDVDVVCVGFGPATGGFLTTLGRALTHEDGTPRLESRVAPGLPLQVLCFERADDVGVGVSGVVTSAAARRPAAKGRRICDCCLRGNYRCSAPTWGAAGDCFTC